ncbi:MAG: cell division protein [Rhodospirillaceae bacterium]|jgi:cell division transport system permease protein|nr:cell division protein [Rhodospirillaceae bacterium]|tara:strand:- start:2596 stop:3477 length:882 start_codon:yes stop_codon:yes gene_type:complete
MFTRRSDLPLDKDAHSRFLPWLIAFMVFLAIMAMAGMLVLNATASRWDQGIRGTLTVQVMPAEDPAKDDERLQAVLSVLAQTPEIDSYETLTDDRLLKLLEPWLGPASGSRDLPLPRLVDVELKTGADLDAEVLSRRLVARVPGASVDDHRIWLKHLVRLIQTVEGLATLVLAFIALATVGTVVFTTRTGLDVHREAIEVLHLIGAQDSYVAGQFANRAFSLGLRGGFFGLLLAVPTLLGIGYLAQQMDSSLLPDVTLGPVHWSALAGLPLVVSLIAMVTARMTVMKTLSRML